MLKGTRMNGLETFDYMTDIVDKWIGEKPGRYEGSCKVLRKDTWAREIIVTPGFCISESMLKTFLMAEVMDIYAKWRTDARISWKNMREALAGEAKKKYSFCFKTLVQCFSPEKNKEAARKTHMLEEQDGLVDDIENWEDIPLYLLNRLQETFQKKLGEYWRMCGKSCEEEDQNYEMRKKLEDKKEVRKEAKEENRENSGKKKRREKDAEYYRDKKITTPKREKYRECIMAAVLHEIFVREVLENGNRMLEEHHRLKKILCESMNQRVTEVMNLIDVLEGQEEEGRVVSKEQIENIMKELKEPRMQLERFMVYCLICLEHCISVEAEIQLLMLLEVKRLSILGHEIEYLDYLYFIQDRNLDDRGKYNRNKKECYRRLDSDVKDIFISYMNRFHQKKISNVSDKEIFRAIEKYLEIIEQRSMDDGRREELWDAQCLMVIPLMCKAYSRK